MTGRKNKVKELPELNSAWLGPPALVWPRPPAWSPHSLGVGMGPGLMRPRPPARSLPTLCLPDGTLPAILHAISVKRWLWTYRSKLPSLCQSLMWLTVGQCLTERASMTPQKPTPHLQCAHGGYSIELSHHPCLLTASDISYTVSA